MRTVIWILTLSSISILLSCVHSGKQGNLEGQLVFSDDFSHGLDKNLWVIEMDSTPTSQVYVENGTLITDTEGGVTIWLNKELKGNYIIEYQRTVIMMNGVNDRLSDLNQFWNASDPKSTHLFTRTGKFEEYDDLSQYYIGVGGNYNSTTRFRKYDGLGERIIIDEKNSEEFLLQPNTTYLVRILVNNGHIRFSMNDKIYFEYDDPDPLTKGYFGFRSTWSRHKIDYINIYQLKG